LGLPWPSGWNDDAGLELAEDLAADSTAESLEAMFHTEGFRDPPSCDIQRRRAKSFLKSIKLENMKKTAFKRDKRS
jgi:hypothetical protein